MASTSALTLASFVKVLHAVFLCKPSPLVRETKINEAKWPMSLPMALLAGLCVLFGAFAHAIPLRYLIQPAIDETLAFSGTWLAARVAAFLLIMMVIG